MSRKLGEAKADQPNNEMHVPSPSKEELVYLLQPNKNTAIIEIWLWLIWFAMKCAVDWWIITAVLCTSNCTKCRSRGTSLSGESNRVYQSDYSLRQLTVTKGELIEFFPVRFAEVLATLFSDAVAGWIIAQLPRYNSVRCGHCPFASCSHPLSPILL